MVWVVVHEPFLLSNVYELLVHCWVSGAAHGACTCFCVWVVVPGCDSLLPAGCCGWLVVVGVVCENCIVDASILFFVCVCFVCVLGYSCVCLLFKGAWWMPWHAEPMKDV